MDAFIFQAALLCEDCGSETRRAFISAGEAPDNPDDESSYDSDDFPKGPFPDGGGEADTPQHCDRCNVFLENPLTPEGVEHVLEMMRDDVKYNETHRLASRVWGPFYGFTIQPRDGSPGYDHAAGYPD